MQRRNGFSLIELMVVIAIVAIVASIAAPSFNTMILNNRISSTTSAQLGFLQLARSEAVMRRGVITVCASSDQATCTGGGTNWEQGAVMLRATAPRLLKVLPPAATAVQVRGAGNSLTYRADGTLAAAAAITICDSRGAASSRRIDITFIGQASSGANNACP